MKQAHSLQIRHKRSKTKAQKKIILKKRKEKRGRN